MSVQTHHSNQGHTLSVIYKNRCYHFRKERNTLELSTVDLLDTEESIPGELVEIPQSLKDELDYYIVEQ